MRASRVLGFLVVVGTAFACRPGFAQSPRPWDAMTALRTQLKAICSTQINLAMPAEKFGKVALPRRVDADSVCACALARIDADPTFVKLLPSEPQLSRDRVAAKDVARATALLTTAAVMRCLSEDLAVMAGSIEFVHADGIVPDDPPSSTHKTITAVAIDDGFRVIDDYSTKDDLYADLFLIPGAIYGRSSQGAVLLVPAPIGRSFTIRIDELERSIEPQARPLAEDAAAKGWKVEPSDARIARVGQMYFDMQRRETTGGAAFFDANSREPLMLVYADRPCRVTGGDSKETVLDLQIPTRGLHWVRLGRSGPKQWRGTVVTAPTLPIMFGLFAFSRDGAK